jgi:hypothetical protein
MRIKHKLGDKVKVIDERSFWHGQEGVVSRFNENLQYNVFVMFKDNTQCNFRHKELISNDT